MRRVTLVLALAVLLAGCGSAEERSADDCGENLACPSLSEPVADAGAEDASARPARPGALDERIRALQRVGLFAGRDPRQAAEEVRRAYRREWDEPLEVTRVYDEIVVASYDRRRTWWQDTESDVIEGNEELARTLRAWARISRGTFRPRRIREDWEDPELGPVTVRFDLGGPRAVRAAGLGAWLDLCVVPQLNALIPGERKLEVVVPFDQTAFVVALTPRERRLLEARGWAFARGEGQLRRAFELGRGAEEGPVGDVPC